MGKVLPIITGIIGALAGAGAVYGYFTYRHKNNTDREYQEYEDRISDLQRQLAEKNENLKEDMIPSTNMYQEVVEEVSQKTTDEPETAEDIDDEEENSVYVEDFGDDIIRFISPKDYEDDDDYEKEEIKYYVKDDILTQDDEVIERVEFENLCGAAALRSFGKYGADTNEIYVRNEHFCTDYKIKRYNMSYERYINGMK